jgi:hypothetical protein
VKQRIEGTATLSPRVKLSDTLSVGQLEDLAINPTTSLPVALFRVGTKLYYGELDENGDATTEKVWDGTNDYDHDATSRGRLMFDAQGSLFVVAHPDVANSDPRRVIYSQVRVLNQTGFSQVIVDGADGKETIQGAALDNWGQSTGGLKASTMRQGTAMAVWLLGDGEANSVADLYLVFPDRFPGQGVYPDIEQSVTGQLPPRREPVLGQLPSVVLTGEGAAATSYPYVPDHAYSDGTVRPTDLLRYEIGQVGGRPKYTDGRQVVIVRHNALTRAEFATLDTFMKARYDDLALFNFTRADGTDVLKVWPIAKTWRWKRIGPDVFEASHKILESP